MDWQQLIQLILSGVTGYNIDINNMAQGIDPKEAVGQVSGRYDEIRNLLNKRMAGINDPSGQYNPQHPLTKAQNRAQQSVNRPVTPPAPFNPYAQNQNQGQLDPALTQRLMGFAMGNNAPATRESNVNMLQQSLTNRFTPRAMGSGTPPVNNSTPPGGTLPPPGGALPPPPSGGRPSSWGTLPQHGGILPPPGQNIVNRDYSNPQGLPGDLTQRSIATSQGLSPDLLQRLMRMMGGG